MWTVGGVLFKTRYFNTQEEAAWEFYLKAHDLLIDEPKPKLLAGYRNEYQMILSELANI